MEFVQEVTYDNGGGVQWEFYTQAKSKAEKL